MAIVRRLTLALVVGVLWTLPLRAQAPSGTVSGRVVDSATRLPLADVSVVIEGTRLGTVTREDGTFLIGGVPVGVHTVRARRIGYGSPQLSVAIVSNGRATADFELGRRVAILEEVVTTGYGTQRRLAITGSIATIDADAANVGAIANVDQMIQGRAAGVNITQNSGEPGAGTQIRIRGGTSISASNDPLYVIDGVPIDNIPTEPAAVGISNNEPPLPRNPMNLINPSDILSISVLKDAAAAIYGTRAANGVIVIETKKGAAGGPSVEYEFSAGRASMNRHLDVLSGPEYRDFVTAQVAAMCGTPPAPCVSPTILANLGSADTDWESAISRDANVVNHNLSFAGGSANTQYRASLNHLNQQGVILSNGFKRYQARLNGSHQAIDGRLRLALNLTGSHIKNDYLPFENTGGFEGGVFINTIVYNPTLPVTVTDPATEEDTFYEIPNVLTVRNPVALAEEIQDFGTTTRSLGNLSGDLDLFKGLTGRVALGVDRFDSNRGTYFPRSNPVGEAFQGLARQSNRNNTSKTIQTILTFQPELSASHDFSILGGYEFVENNLSEFAAESRGFLTDALGYNSLSSGSTIQPLESRTEDSRLVGFFSRATYSFMDRYFLTGVLRRDGSSRFGEGNKWAVFPAISGSVRLTQTGFVPTGPFSELRLRAGWGKQGNPAIPPYASLLLLAADGGSRYVFGDRAVTGFSPTQNPNADLKWEETAQTNVALDYGFMNNRFTGSVEYYIKNTRDLLLRVSVPQPAVVSTRLENIGRTRNKGLEFALDAQVMDRPNLNWTAGFVLDVQRNSVVDLGERSFISTGRVSGEGQSDSRAQRIIPGEPIGTFWGPEFVGVNAAGLQEFNNYDVTRDPDGRVLTRTLNGTTTAPDADDDVIIGNANPNYSFGLRSQVNFGKFDLSMLVNSQRGLDVFNNTALVYATKGNATRSKNFLSSALTDNVGIREPQIYSSRWIEDGSFVRLQNITVGYTFDMPRFMGTARQTRVFLSGDNLILMTDYTGYDPEVHTDASIDAVATRGIDYLHYPRPRTITGGLRVAF
jgi:TonB-linked SusC/RagA family outer membrane protein